MQNSLFSEMLLGSAFIGSFLGLVVVRLPAGRAMVFGRSECESCHARLSPVELVPIFSFIFLRGRCRHCGAGIGGTVLVIELAAMAVVIWAATVASGMALAATSVLGWMLLVLATIDIRYLRLPNSLTFSLLIAGLVAALLLERAHLLDHVVGAIAGYALLAGVRFLYRRARGRDGLGLGDAKLLGALGAWVSWQGLPSVVLMASLMGLAVVAVGALRRRGAISAETKYPLGAYLAASGWLVWLYGPLLAA